MGAMAKRSAAIFRRCVRDAPYDAKVCQQLPVLLSSVCWDFASIENPRPPRGAAATFFNRLLANVLLSAYFRMRHDSAFG